MAKITVKVRTVKREALDILSFELAPTAGLLPPFTPGAHIDVHLASGVVRQYSLINAPDETTVYKIAVKLDPNSRGGSRAMHEDIQEGQLLEIGEPRNNFQMVEGAKHSLFFAGGIGVTPLVSMLQHLHARDESFELQYFSRALEYTAFSSLLSQTEFSLKVGLHFALDAAAVRDYANRRLSNRPDQAHLYICGPRPFMDVVKQAAVDNGWPSDAIHLEYFSADIGSATDSQSTFTVRCARSGGEYKVAADESIVDVLRGHSIAIETSCEQGVCGTCLTRVLDGEPDHRDVYLTDQEKQSGNCIMPCVSRAASSILVLDV